jgi:hypothetical protein
LLVAEGLAYLLDMVARRKRMAARRWVGRCNAPKAGASHLVGGGDADEGEEGAEDGDAAEPLPEGRVFGFGGFGLMIRHWCLVPVTRVGLEPAP